MYNATDKYYVEYCLKLVLIKYPFYSVFTIESLKFNH